MVETPVGMESLRIFTPKTPEELSPVPDGPAQDKISDTSHFQTQLALGELVAEIRSKFIMAENARRPQEQLWVEDWQLFNGELSPEEKSAISRAKERNINAAAFSIPITKTKTMAAYGQVCEILFGDNRFPIRVEPTPIPDGIEEEISIVAQETPDIYGYEGDGRYVEPGATATTLLGGLKDKVNALLSGGKKVVKGTVPDPQAIKISPAEETAAKMDKLIQDQLHEQNIESELRMCALESCILGTGVMKRPLTFLETQHNWVQGDSGVEYQQVEKMYPKASFVTLWNFYPDPYARRITDASFVIERHRLNRHKLKSLKFQKYFIKKSIDELLNKSGNYVPKWWEATTVLTNTQETATPMQDEYEVLEYTGYFDKELLSRIPDISKEEVEKYADMVPANVWISEDKVLRIVLNPFTVDAQWYYPVPYEEHPNQIWGKGIPRNARAMQAIVDGSMRMAVDNLKFAGSIMFEVNENNLAAGQDMTIYNGKIFYTNGGAPGQSVYAITTPNVAPSNMQLADKARQFMDEAVGQPSYSHGQYTTGQTRTASGMSMLMQAATVALKQVVKNFDQYLLEPMGQAYFHWNMQFNRDIPEIRGDMRIVAKGTQAVMQREVHSQRLLSLIQVGANPLVAPFVNWEYTIKEVAKSLGVDSEKAVNDPAKAMLYAELMGKVNAAQQGTPEGTGAAPGGSEQQGTEQAVGGISPADTSGAGGGNIGVGSPPQPGQSGFSASA